MRVRIIKPGRVYHGDRIRTVGEELDVPEDVARAWERAGVAEVVTPAPAGPSEQPIATPEEDKETPRRGRRKRG